MDFQQGFEENGNMQVLGEGSATTKGDNASTAMNVDGVTILQDQITDDQINTSAANEANPPDDASSDEEYDSDTCSEDPVLEEMKRKLAMYQDMYDESLAKQIASLQAEQNAGDPPSKNFQRLILLRTVRNHERALQEAVYDGAIRGLVFGVFLEDGSILKGSSFNLRGWWEEHCRDYENVITAPEQQNSESLFIEPNLDDNLVVTSDVLSTIQSDANRFKAARILDRHRQTCAEHRAAGRRIRPMAITFKETTAFDGDDHIPILMACYRHSNMAGTTALPSLLAVSPPSTSEEMVPVQDKQEDMLYHQADNHDCSPDEPAP